MTVEPEPAETADPMESSSAAVADEPTPDAESAPLAAEPNPADPIGTAAQEAPEEPWRPVLPRMPRAARFAGRDGTARQVYRILNRAERIRLRRRLPFTLTADLGIRRHNGRLRVVRMHADTAGHTAVRTNLDIVVAVCERAGIGYFAVPEPNARRARVGIAAEHWDAFIDELLDRGRRTPLYVGVAALRKGRARRWADLTTEPLIARAMREQDQLEIFEIAAASAQSPIFDRPWACVVERWSRDPDGTLRSNHHNARSTVIDLLSQKPGQIVRSNRHLESFEVFTTRDLFEIDFPIDVVYTWVDGGDAQWLERKATALEALGRELPPTTAGDERFRDNGELRFSLRSIEEYAPWIRHIYLVTDRQVPAWLTETSRLTVVDHRDIFGSAGTLPTFNSHAIGARLHHIDDLSEQYLHFNDDVFLGRGVLPGAFFHSTGLSKFFLSRSTLPFTDPGSAPAHEAARRNAVHLLQRDFGRSPSRAFFHVPIPQRRSVMFELEQRYPGELATTWNNQFRDGTDVEVNSWLHHYYGYLVGKAVAGSISYDYFDVSDDRAWTRMQRLTRSRHRDVFCLNDTELSTAEQRERAAEWLESYFPRRSSFER